MGMYDDVILEMKCPECGALVTGFQSKNGPCTLSKLQPYEIDHLYASCDECGAWIVLNTTSKAATIMEQMTAEMHRKLAHEYDRVPFDEWFTVSSKKRGA